MSKCTVGLIGVFVLVCFPAFGQNAYPKGEVFGGFSIITLSNGDSEHAFGWQASVAGNFHRNVGIVADFGGEYKTVTADRTDVSAKAHEFLFGPQFNARRERANPFAHVLFGGANGRASADSESVSRTVFMMGFGGGVDVDVSSRISVRLFQFDWLPIHTEGEWFNKIFRVGFGIVIKAGGS